MFNTSRGWGPYVVEPACLEDGLDALLSRSKFLVRFDTYTWAFRVHQDWVRGDALGTSSYVCIHSSIWGPGGRSSELTCECRTEFAAEPAIDITLFCIDNVGRPGRAPKTRRTPAKTLQALPRSAPQPRGRRLDTALPIQLRSRTARP